jgi:hypothetical protein
LLYCICALSSVSRDYPRHVFHRLRSLVNGLIRCNEILSHPKMEYIQGLLIIGLTGEIHAQPTSPTASTAVIRDGVAIRMAQDLGLHREPKAKPTTPAQLAAAESRRRVWAVCVFIDRWLQNGLDMPQIIDIHDCNILVPSPRQIVPGVEPEKWPINNHYLGLGENLKLALISGRIVKLMYGPSELTNVTDEQLESALAELNDWRTNIPKVLQFAGPESPFLNGFLHIQFSAVSFLFWRCFLRVKQPVPSHIKLVLDTNRWAELVQWSRESIEWLNLHDRTLDTLFVLPYSATSCALIQYHTWARRRDPAALETLKLVCDVVERWEAAVKPDQMSIRKKSCETMMLLYEAALKTTQEDDRTDRSDGTPTSSTTGPRSVAAEPGSSSAPTPAFPTRRAQPTTELYTSGEGPSLVEYDHQPEHIPMFEDATELDMSFLDSIPESNFDWSGW